MKAVPVENGEVPVENGSSPAIMGSGSWGHIAWPSTFSARLGYAVEADNELSTWLERKKLRVSLTPGLPAQLMWRWGVAIDAAVGEPFLSSWKAYLASLASCGCRCACSLWWSTSGETQTTASALW